MNDCMIDNRMVGMDARPSQHLQRRFPTIACFLTNLTLLTLLTNLTDDLPLLRHLAVRNVRSAVRNVRFSDKSDCACGEKSNFSLSFSRVSPSRARKQICQKTPSLVQPAPAVPERVVS